LPPATTTVPVAFIPSASTATSRENTPRGSSSTVETVAPVAFGLTVPQKAVFMLAPASKSAADPSRPKTTFPFAFEARPPKTPEYSRPAQRGAPPAVSAMTKTCETKTCEKSVPPPGCGPNPKLMFPVKVPPRMTSDAASLATLGTMMPAPAAPICFVHCKWH
jgi:hypothetical protein